MAFGALFDLKGCGLKLRIDDFDLPGRENNFTLNLSRPIEWIATCPIMQLKLVVLAGARVPSYRRFMPLVRP